MYRLHGALGSVHPRVYCRVYHAKCVPKWLKKVGVKKSSNKRSLFFGEINSEKIGVISVTSFAHPVDFYPAAFRCVRKAAK